MSLISQRIADTSAAMAPFNRFMSTSVYARRGEQNPHTCDFVFGNPNEPVLPDFVSALQHWSKPQTNDWYAYTFSAEPARAAVMAELRARTGQPFTENDILLTSGAFAGIAITLAAILDQGDEVIFLTPAWFFYAAQITAAGGKPVPVPVDSETFDIDLEALAAALNERTRAVIINSPHNPTGKIYPPATLERLAAMLTEASTRFKRPIALLSDEAYRRIVFDGNRVPSPAGYYPNTFIIYTYGKTLLTPGQRMGYIALPPPMPERAKVYAALFTAQVALGLAVPNALLQHAWPDLERLSINIAHLQQKRDRLVTALREIGYELHIPEGTFYLLVRTPFPDDWAFAELLATHQIYCLPGSVADLPGYIRLSLTASDAMIERALPGFQVTWEEAAVALS